MHYPLLSWLYAAAFVFDVRVGDLRRVFITSAVRCHPAGQTVGNISDIALSSSSSHCKIATLRDISAVVPSRS